MANTYFKFKQFTIYQDKCAMKVCTDACLFGAWLTLPKNTVTVLDIGAGTGLLSLMLAQKKSNLKIDAIEIDKNAYEQCKENFEASIWKDRLNTINGDIKDYSFNKKYDYIISNPPFFENEQKSINEQEIIAKHASQLTLSELIKAMVNNLTEDGQFAVLLPYYRKQEMEKLALQYNYYPITIALMQHSKAHPYFRYTAIFSREQNTPNITNIIIQEEKTYTSATVELLQPYYLFL